MSDADLRNIDIVNDLIEVTVDSADGYAEAAQKVTNAYLRGSFARWAEDRRQVIKSLKAHVSALGGNPELEGSLVGSVHRVVAKLHEAIVSGDGAVVETLECGEDRVKHRYQEALQDPSLAVPTRRVIERAYVSIAAGHEQASALKRSMRN